MERPSVSEDLELVVCRFSPYILIEAEVLRTDMQSSFLYKNGFVFNVMSYVLSWDMGMEEHVAEDKRG